MNIMFNFSILKNLQIYFARVTKINLLPLRRRVSLLGKYAQNNVNIKNRRQ